LAAASQPIIKSFQSGNLQGDSSSQQVVPALSGLHGRALNLIG